MHKHKLLLSIIILICISTVYAEEITINAPTAGAVINPQNDELTFIITNGDIIKSCDLLIDNTVMKSSPYNNVLKGRPMEYRLEYADGDHTAQIKCTTEKGSIASEVRSFTIRTPVNPVKVAPSGVVRGSMQHSFKITNGGAPVIVKKVAAGDYLEIQFFIPPSTIKKELYVRQRGTNEGKDFAILEDMKKREKYTVFEGENTTINITPNRVYISVLGIENNRVNFIVSPTITGTRENTETTATQENNEASDTSPPTIDNTPPTGKPVQPTQINSDATPLKNTTKETKDEQPKQGAFKRFFSWFARVFG